MKWKQPYKAFFFHKMAAGGHFGRPKITFYRISHHFRKIRNFFWNFFTKWLTAAILEDRKSLSIAFLAISDQYTTFMFFKKWLPAAILDDRKSLSIAFLAISDQYATFYFFQNGHRWPFWKPDFGHLHDRKSLSIIFSRHFRSIHILFFKFLSKWPQTGHFGNTICTKNNRVLPLCVINGYAKYEVNR